LDGEASVRRGRHLVHFYADERDLARTVSRYVVETLRSGGVAVAEAAAGHLLAIEVELCRVGIDLAAAHEAGSLVTFDVEPTARRVVIDGRMDPDQPDAVRGDIVGWLAARRGPRFVYGELSPMLWEAGMVDTALTLEARINERVAELDITLLCGYRSESLRDAGDRDDVLKLCHHHTYLTSLPFVL
jgi:MEDS: MEthanogen/methylotroph, DcmR Sensory domain